MIIEQEKECPLLLTQRVISGKWKLSILWFLRHHEVMRFGQLKAAFEDPTLSQKMLTQHLRELEADKIIDRKVYPEVPPKVEYRLSSFGLKLSPIIDSMENWGRDYMTDINHKESL